MISSVLLASSAAALLASSSSSFVEANPNSASNCNLWVAGASDFGPHQQEPIGTTGGNVVTVVGASSYTPNTPVSLTVASGATFQGFQIFATDSTGRRVGTFDATGTNSAGLVNDQGCSGSNPQKPNTAGSTFSHNSSQPKPANMQIKWIPDPTAVGTVSFTATVMPGSSQFYQAKVASIPRSASAPAPVAVVDPTAPVAAPVVVAPVVAQPTVGPVQTTPTSGSLTIQGMGTAQVFNPYLKQPVAAVVVPVASSSAAPAVTVGSSPTVTAAPTTYGVFQDDSYAPSSSSTVGQKTASYTNYNPAALNRAAKKSSAVAVSTVAAVTLSVVALVASFAL